MPADPASVPDASQSDPAHDDDFFEDREHDGWSSIVKRRTPPPAPSTRTA